MKRSLIIVAGVAFIGLMLALALVNPAPVVPSATALKVAQEATDAGVSPEMLEAGADAASLDVDQQHIGVAGVAAQGLQRAGTGIELWGFSLVLDTSVARAVFFLGVVLVGVVIVGIAFLLLREKDAPGVPAVFWGLVAFIILVTLAIWSILA